MRILDILKEIGHERGLAVREDGSLVGMIRDYPFLVQSVNYGNFDAVSITIRTAPGDFTALKKPVKAVKGLKAPMLKSIGDGSLQYLIPYWLSKGKLKGNAIAAVLVLASIFAGEILAHIWFIGKATGRLDTSLAYHGYMNILLNNPRTLIFTVIFALAGVWIGVATLSKMEKDAKGDDLS